jgi:hypothetical protein
MLLAVRSDAAILAEYRFNSSLRISTDTDLFTVATSFNDGAGWTASFDAVRGNPTPSLAVDSTQTNGATEANVVAANDYFTFTLTPVAGMQMTLTRFAFDYANYSNDATFPTEAFFVRCSLDNFTADLDSPVTALPASAGAFTTELINLNNPAFQNITTSVEFRIYIGDTANNANRGALIDNAGILGTTAPIPEPSTWALIVGGAGFLFSACRLRRKSR